MDLHLNFGQVWSFITGPLHLVTTEHLASRSCVTKSCCFVVPFQAQSGGVWYLSDVVSKSIFLKHSERFNLVDVFRKDVPKFWAQKKHHSRFEIGLDFL